MQVGLAQLWLTGTNLDVDGALGSQGIEVHKRVRGALQWRVYLLTCPP